jgi:uncharacterized protein YfbU (UPF0304 family)
MDINKTNRLLLVNQFKILSILEKTDEYNDLIKILENGYKYEYNDIYYNINKSVSKEQCKYVRVILNMFDTLQISFSKLQTNKIIEDDVIFKGFDANDNDESYLMSYTEFLIEDLNRYQFIKKIEGYNSHCPMLPTYNKMYETYKTFNKELNKDLTENEILQICYWK